MNNLNQNSAKSFSETDRKGEPFGLTDDLTKEDENRIVNALSCNKNSSYSAWQKRRLKNIYPIAWLDKVPLTYGSGSIPNWDFLYYLYGIDLAGNTGLISFWVGNYYFDIEESLSNLYYQDLEKILILVHDDKIETPKNQIRLFNINTLLISSQLLTEAYQKTEIKNDILKLFTAEDYDKAKVYFADEFSKWKVLSPLVYKNVQNTYKKHQDIFQVSKNLRKFIYSFPEVYKQHLKIKELIQEIPINIEKPEVLELIFESIIDWNSFVVNRNYEWNIVLQTLQKQSDINLFSYFE